MEDYRIIYKRQGSVNIMAPCKCGLSVDQIARKDVPKGLPYKIVHVSELPEDREFRDAWDIDSSLLTDGVGEYVEPRQREKL